MHFSCFLSSKREKDADAIDISNKFKVPFKSLTIDDEEFACINYTDRQTGVKHFVCDYDRVLNKNVKGDRIFRTIHHEFALHAGVEKKTGKPVSDFFVSNQVARYAHPETVWLLGPELKLGCTIEIKKSGSTPQCQGCGQSWENSINHSLGGLVEIIGFRPVEESADALLVVEQILRPSGGRRRFNGKKNMAIEVSMKLIDPTTMKTIDSSTGSSNYTVFNGIRAQRRAQKEALGKLSPCETYKEVTQRP